MDVWDELIYTQFMDSDMNSFYSQSMDLCDKHMRNVCMYSNYIAHLIIFLNPAICIHSSSYSIRAVACRPFDWDMNDLPDVWRSQGANGDPPDVSQQPWAVLSFRMEGIPKNRDKGAK